jgi:hypothetical protein
MMLADPARPRPSAVPRPSATSARQLVPPPSMAIMWSTPNLLPLSYQLTTNNQVPISGGMGEIRINLNFHPFFLFRLLMLNKFVNDH